MVLGLPSHGHNARRPLSILGVHDGGILIGVLAAQLLAVLGAPVLHKDRAVGVLLNRAGAAQVLQIAEAALVALHAGAVDLAQLHNHDAHLHGGHFQPPCYLADALVLGLARVGGT